jgi:glycosyltransferase involved in cell wall biosynthesis
VRISVVIPSFNGWPYINEAIRSIRSQDGPQDRPFYLDWVVVDGGSTDFTLNFLNTVPDPRMRCVSEPDRGQSHAINKGLAMAGGDVVGWLNADDVYTPGALAAVAEAFERNPSAQWLVGRCEIIDARGAVVRAGVTRYKDRSLRRYSYRKLLRENFISQPAVFWRREFGNRVGPLDESLHYTMDYDLWLRMGRECNPLLLDRVLAHFRVHETSKSGRVNREQFDEQYRVAGRYFGGDRVSRWVHRFNVEKIVWAYRVMRAAGL